MAELIEKGREALGRIGAESAKAAGVLADWQAAIETYTGVDECNAALPKVEALTPVAVKAQVKKVLWVRAQALGLTFDTTAKAFTAPAKKAEPKPEPETFVLV
jgi:hypothetical protein